MYRYLKNYTDKVSCIINQGKQHGIKNFDIEQLKDVDILIIVDSMNSAEDYQRLCGTETEIIVLDHHIIEEGVLDCPITLVSSANNYGNPQLSGAGVCWKVCKYMDEQTLNNYADDLVDLATCGIIADMCEVGLENAENRAICNLGFNHQVNLGIKKINGSYEFNAQAVSFGIATLVNAACRTFQNEKALQLFISDDTKEVNRLIRELKSAKEQQNEAVIPILEDIDRQYQLQKDSKVLLFLIESDLDIAGLIGNKLLERYQRPLFVLRHKNDRLSGSARGIGVDNFKKYVDNIGLAVAQGHEQAFGIDFAEQDKDVLIEKLNTALKDVEFVNERDVDVEISADQITPRLINVFKKTNKVSGAGFKPLNVVIKDITEYSVGTMSNGKHLKIVCDNFTAIKWNYTGNIDEFGDGIINKRLSFVGQLDANYFGKTYTMQLIIDDYKVEDI